MGLFFNYFELKNFGIQKTSKYTIILTTLESNKMNFSDLFSYLIIMRNKKCPYLRSSLAVSIVFAYHFNSFILNKISVNQR